MGRLSWIIYLFKSLLLRERERERERERVYASGGEEEREGDKGS